MSKSQDADLGLKLRFRRVLFLLGYWSPIEVELSQYEAEEAAIKRTSLTDLDVLGVKYDALFTPFRVVGDCKSGRNVSDANRMFWLKGVKEYFGADEAYFIHTTIKAHTRSIAPKLGLRVLDEDGLLNLEKNLGVDKLNIPLADISANNNISYSWGINVPKGEKPTKEQLEFKKVYSYLSYTYWYIDQHRNLLNIIGFFSSIAHLLNDKEAAHTLLAYTGLERFTHSLLEAASFAMAQGANSTPRDFRTYVYGGALELKEKESFFKLLRDLTKATEQLDPIFINDVIELFGRMIRNPKGACDILRHIVAVYFRNVYLGETGFAPIGEEPENTPARVLTRDVALTFAKVTGIKESIFAEILSL